MKKVALEFLKYFGTQTFFLALFYGVLSFLLWNIDVTSETPDKSFSMLIGQIPFHHILLTGFVLSVLYLLVNAAFFNRTMAAKSTIFCVAIGSAIFYFLLPIFRLLRSDSLFLSPLSHALAWLMFLVLPLAVAGFRKRMYITK